MQKLTLSVDAKVVGRAKRFAASHGTSVSRMVETYLDLVASPSAPTQDDPPALKLLRGAARGTNPAEYDRYLVRKFR